MLSLGGTATVAKAVGFLLVLAWAATLACHPGREARSLLTDQRWLVVFATGLVAWSVLSTAWAQSRSAALLGASRYAQDLVLLPILYTGVTRFKHVRWVAAAFVGGAIAATLYGLLTGVTVDGSRLVGALGDPNETAAVMLAAAALAGALATSERLTPPRRAGAVAAAVAALVALAATASRGGLVALAVAALAAVVIGGRGRPRVTAVVVVGGVVVVAWFMLLAPSSSRNHVTSLQTGRTTLWTVAARTIGANPLVGVGNDNFAVISKDYLIQPGVTTDAGQVILDPKVAHNIYLELWADLGIVGLALFVGLVLMAVRAAWATVRLLQRAGRRADEILARALIVAIAGMLVADFFISDLYSKQLFLLLGLAPAMLAAARRDVRRAVA
jgi:O-antigen ligase